MTNGTRLIDALRATLNEVTQTCHLPADDPALLQLKSILLQRIATLHAAELKIETASDALTGLTRREEEPLN